MIAFENPVGQINKLFLKIIHVNAIYDVTGSEAPMGGWSGAPASTPQGVVFWGMVVDTERIK